MKKINESEKKKINLGIEFLRFILSLWIVFLHCSKIKKHHQKYVYKGFHVPTFILISFYFYFPYISKRDISKIISRFQRLLIPYILWPIILLFINILHNFNISMFYSIGVIHIKFLFIQLLIGSTIHNIFWFQFNLLYISLFLTIISFIFTKNVIKIFIFIGIISFYFHISRLNYKVVNNFKKIIFRNNLGSIIELMPIAINGCILGSINFLSRINNSSLYLNFYLSLILIILFEYKIFFLKFDFTFPLLFCS